MKKTMASLLSVAILSMSNLAMAARPTPLTVKEIERQRPLTFKAYKEGILKENLKMNSLRDPHDSRKDIVKEIKRITGWEIPAESPTENIVEFELLDIMRGYFDFFGSIYLMLVSTLTDAQREDSKNYTHYYLDKTEISIPQKPDWQKDWSELHIGVSYHKELLPRLLAIAYFTNPYHVLERAKYNYVHNREEGMAPARMVQIAEELPWFNQCVQDTYTSTILNKKYAGTSLDMKKMLPIIKAHKESLQNIQEKIDEMKFEIGDTYVRRYLQKRKLDQNDQDLDLTDRLRASIDVKEIPANINKIAPYCVAAHASAEILQDYDMRYGAEIEETVETK